MLLPSGNPFKCHEEVLYFQLLIPPKRFDIFFPLTGGCSEGLGAFRFFFKQLEPVLRDQFLRARAGTGKRYSPCSGSIGKHTRLESLDEREKHVKAELVEKHTSTSQVENILNIVL